MLIPLRKAGSANIGPGKGNYQIKTMNKYLIIGLLTGGLGFFGCNNNSKVKVPKSDTSDVATVNLNDILYTIPTINNSLPEFTDIIDSCVSFHEDEWRQIEFISKDQKGSIDKEIAKIKDIYDNFSQKSESYTAFTNVALRELIKQPLSIDYSKLKSYFLSNKLKTKGLRLDNNPGQVKGGFYFSYMGINYYGIVENGLVKTFCIYSADSEDDLKSAINILSNILSKEKLYLVDWRPMTVLDDTNIKTELVKETN